MINWTAEQIIAMAPDPGAASAGRGLAARSKWLSIGSGHDAAWGECQSSGARPYQVQIDLREPAFKCSCPSFKFPCKHALGLFLLWAEQEAPAGDPPQWVVEWLVKRAAATETKQKRSEPRDADSEARSAATQQKRAAGRESRVAAGIDELDRWLRDLVRGGLAAAQAQPGRFWEGMAARMVDSQAPGLARRIREMAVIPASGQAWAERLLERIARLRLLMEGYRRIEAQSEEMQATIRSHVGWTIKQEELTQKPGVRAEWLVVGRRVTEEDRLLAQRTWLLSREGAALLLHFTMKGQSFELSFMPGSCLDAELVYFPGALRQRAVVKSLLGEAPTLKAVPCHRDSESLLKQFAAALAADPWLESYLAVVTGVTPIRLEDLWLIRDGSGRALPLNKSFQKAWQLRALSGGQPVTLFGEWDGHSLLPLCTMADGRFVDLSPARGL